MISVKYLLTVELPHAIKQLQFNYTGVNQMSIMSVEGTIVVAVDEVDIEQARIANPRLLTTFLMQNLLNKVAREKDDFKSFERNLFRTNHALEYVGYESSRDYHFVTFNIVKIEDSIIERHFGSGVESEEA